MSDPIKSSDETSEDALAQPSLEAELKLLIQEGSNFENQFIADPDVTDSDEFEDQLEAWGKKVKQFGKQGALLTKGQEQVLKYLEKKAGCLSD